MWYIRYLMDKIEIIKTNDINLPSDYEKIEDDNNLNCYDVDIKINPNINYYDGYPIKEENKKKFSNDSYMKIRNYYDFNEDGIIYIKKSKIVSICGD